MNRQNGRQPSVTLETVTPEIAGDWLEKNTRNRRLVEPSVRRLANAIRRGEWKLNAETIKFSRNGDLLDGQYRLTAVIVANTPIQTLVARDVDEDVFDTIDIGKRRSTSDVLYLKGETNTNQLAAVLSQLHQWRSSSTFQHGREVPTTTQIEALLEREPTIRNVLTPVALLKKHVSGANMSVMGALMHILGEIDRHAANEFFHRLQTGVGMESEADPIHRLRERLLHASIRKDARLLPSEVGALTIKAWNAYRTHKPLRVLAWKSKGETIEPYPQPI